MFLNGYRKLIRDLDVVLILKLNENSSNGYKSDIHVWEENRHELVQ